MSTMSSSHISDSRAGYAILFDNTSTSTPQEGYLFVDMLRKGGNASGVMLVRSAETGKLYVRKYVAPKEDFEIPESEVCLTRDLTDSGFSPRFHSAFSNDQGLYRTLVTDFCNGGNTQTWFSQHATPENREFMAWLLIVEGTRALAHLHSNEATEKGGIWHGDVHAGNIFLHFDADEPIPRILFGDYGLSFYQYEEAKATFQGQDLACDLGFLGDMKYALCSNPVNQPIAESLRHILSLYPKIEGIDTAQQLLEQIEADGAARMTFLRRLPGFSIPKPQVSDIPWLFNTPEITETSLKDLKRLPQNTPGEPQWRWVKIDWTDETFRTFETLPQEPLSPASNPLTPEIFRRERSPEPAELVTDSSQTPGQSGQVARAVALFENFTNKENEDLAA